MPGRVVGQIHGKTIVLESPLPALEGRRVSLSIEVLDADNDDRVDELWRDWHEHGPQGPIDADDEPEFP